MSSTLDQSPTFELMGSTVRPLAVAAETGGAWEAVELTVAPGGATPHHTLSAHKLFYVVTGRVTITSGSRSVLAEAGTAVSVPAGTVHAFTNDTAETARLLVITSGSHHVELLAGMSRLTAGPEVDVAAIAEHLARHGAAVVDQG